MISGSHTRQFIIEIISFLFVLLFVYAAFNKVIEYEKFTAQIGQSPLLAGFGTIVPWLVIVTELAIAILFLVVKYRWLAFLLSFGLMVMFSEYIVAILNFSYYIPCSCGGILESLGWSEHLVFNVSFVILALAGFIFQVKSDQTKPGWV